VTEKRETVVLRVNVEISVGALETLMERAKQAAKTESPDRPRLDTADYVGRAISLFLAEAGFEDYVTRV
jgi:hypothetical protein